MRFRKKRVVVEAITCRQAVVGCWRAADMTYADLERLEAKIDAAWRQAVQEGLLDVARLLKRAAQETSKIFLVKK